jgi:hypothetical protein
MYPVLRLQEIDEIKGSINVNCRARLCQSEPLTRRGGIRNEHPHLRIMLEQRNGALTGFSVHLSVKGDGAKEGEALLQRRDVPDEGCPNDHLVGIIIQVGRQQLIERQELCWYVLIRCIDEARVRGELRKTHEACQDVLGTRENLVA